MHSHCISMLACLSCSFASFFLVLPLKRLCSLLLSLENLYFGWLYFQTAGSVPVPSLDVMEQTPELEQTPLCPAAHWIVRGTGFEGDTSSSTPLCYPQNTPESAMETWALPVLGSCACRRAVRTSTFHFILSFSQGGAKRQRPRQLWLGRQRKKESLKESLLALFCCCLPRKWRTMGLWESTCWQHRETRTPPFGSQPGSSGGLRVWGVSVSIWILFFLLFDFSFLSNSYLNFIRFLFELVHSRQM
jgi:hypothetical protein